MPANKRPRIEDVAKYAQVSEAAVSVVLNGKVGDSVRVSDATQKKIWDAVRELGYVANPVAQRLAGGKNHIIAVFTFEALFPIDVRSFYFPFLVGIEEEADQHGYDLLLITGSRDPSTGKRHIYQNNVNRLASADGAILLGLGDKQEVYQLLEDDFPFVYMGRFESPQDDISYIAADYVSATEQVINYMLKHGHQQMVYVRTTRSNEASIDRLRGFQRAYKVSANKPAVWSGYVEDFTLDVMQEYLRAGITAFVAEDDALGHHILALGDALSLSCPQDFSLSVLGNPLNPIQAVPNWTSFNIPRHEMGREALRLLVSILDQERKDKDQPLRKTLSCTFVPGITTKAI